MFHDVIGDFTFIESGSALLRDMFQCFCKGGIGHDFASVGRAAVFQIMLCAAFVCGEHGFAFRPVPCHARCGGHAVPGQFYGWLQGFAESHGAFLFQKLLPCIDGARNGDGVNTLGCNFSEARRLEPVLIGFGA